MEVFTEFMILISTMLLQQLLRQDLESEAKDVIESMFFAVIIIIVLVNLALLILTVFELWQERKKDKAREKEI